MGKENAERKRLMAALSLDKQVHQDNPGEKLPSPSRGDVENRTGGASISAVGLTQAPTQSAVRMDRCRNWQIVAVTKCRLALGSDRWSA
jgi:hypothetical protein